MNHAEYQVYLRSGAWWYRKLMAIKRAEGRCQVCDAPGLLEVHLRNPARRGAERPSDLLAVCSECAPVLGKIVRSIEYARLLKRRAFIGTREAV